MRFVNRINYALVALPLILGACLLSYNTVAGFDDYGGVFEGTVNVSIGSTGTISLREVGGSITCHGITRILYRPSNLVKRGGQGDASVECSDGRIVNAKWLQTSEDGGHGEGLDQNGNKLRFRYDLDQNKLEEYKRTKLAASSKKPEAPDVYKPKMTRKKKGFSSGTGFFISSSGHFITNYHVVDEARSVNVILESGEELCGQDNCC